MGPLGVFPPVIRFSSFYANSRIFRLHFTSLAIAPPTQRKQTPASTSTAGQLAARLQVNEASEKRALLGLRHRAEVDGRRGVRGGQQDGRSRGERGAAAAAATSAAVSAAEAAAEAATHAARAAGRKVGQRAPSPPRNSSPAALLLWLDFGVGRSRNATYTHLMARVVSTPFMAVSGSSPSCRASTDAATTDSEKCVCSYKGTYTQVATSAADITIEALGIARTLRR